MFNNSLLIIIKYLRAANSPYDLPDELWRIINEFIIRLWNRKIEKLESNGIIKYIENHKLLSSTMQAYNCTRAQMFEFDRIRGDKYHIMELIEKSYKMARDRRHIPLGDSPCPCRICKQRRTELFQITKNKQSGTFTLQEERLKSFLLLTNKRI